ncbi:MAG: Ribosome small subunit biogenesis RbfA-release protein RsgA [Burkholderiaceae bacterium]|nr:MAG: Ribosome small subunit biogenesis RbfA-release protein RsgA [Burkholderiaceae bacterium]
MSEPDASSEGLVVAAHGRHFLVESADRQRRICHPRGKKSEAVVGDRVLWQASRDEGTIERILPRRNLLYRQDRLRTKSFAANLDQVLILLGADPPHSDHQLARALIAAEAAGIAPLIALNKSDLAAPFARGWQRLAPYGRMGYPVLALSLKAGAAADPQSTPTADALAGLRARLAGRTTLLLGPSGAGKSTLVNALVPGAAALTGEISRALGAGRHTTTSTRWYWVDADRTTALIDSPGFQEFGLHHVEAVQLAALMPDVKLWAARCRFYNCTHLHEPGCAVISAIESGQSQEGIDTIRYKIYSELFAELSASKFG